MVYNVKELKSTKLRIPSPKYYAYSRIKREATEEGSEEREEKEEKKGDRPIWL